MGKLNGGDLFDRMENLELKKIIILFSNTMNMVLELFASLAKFKCVIIIDLLINDLRHHDHLITTHCVADYKLIVYINCSLIISHAILVQSYTILLTHFVPLKQVRDLKAN